MVVDLRVTGNDRFTTERIIRLIHTRANRPYDADLVEEDVRRLIQSRMFLHASVSTQEVAGGRVVIFKVVEKPVMQYVKYVGCEKVKKKVLGQQTGLKSYEAIDPYSVIEGRRKIEDYYQSKGFGKVHVTIFEGDKPNDRGVVYIIHEGPKQRVLWTQFEGNKFADDGRLRTQIKSKPGFLWLFGTLDRKQIDEDVNRLTAYYRSMGFFQAKVGRELAFDEAKRWLTLTFVVDEGPRYQVREVRVLGNKIITAGELTQEMKLTAGKPFNQNEMAADALRMQDMYGAIGHVFADVKPVPQFLDEPGVLDLVYQIKEGNQYRVGKIDVQIKGDNPHTRISTVLNQMSIYPGQIVDVRELRAAKAASSAPNCLKTTRPPARFRKSPSPPRTSNVPTPTRKNRRSRVGRVRRRVSVARARILRRTAARMRGSRLPPAPQFLPRAQRRSAGRIAVEVGTVRSEFCRGPRRVHRTGRVGRGAGLLVRSPGNASGLADRRGRRFANGLPRPERHL